MSFENVALSAVHPFAIYAVKAARYRGLDKSFSKPKMFRGPVMDFIPNKKFMCYSAVCLVELSSSGLSDWVEASAS